MGERHGQKEGEETKTESMTPEEKEQLYRRQTESLQKEMQQTIEGIFKQRKVAELEVNQREKV